jgi:hypothetical protein
VTINGGTSAIAHILTPPPGRRDPARADGMLRKPGQRLRLACQPRLQSNPRSNPQSRPDPSPAGPGCRMDPLAVPNRSIVSRYSFRSQVEPSHPGAPPSPSRS